MSDKLQRDEKRTSVSQWSKRTWKRKRKKGKQMGKVPKRTVNVGLIQCKNITGWRILTYEGVRIRQMGKVSYMKRITLKRGLYRNAWKDLMINLSFLYDATVAWKPSTGKVFISQKAHLLVWKRGMNIILLRCHAYLVSDRVTTFPLFINAVFVDGHWPYLTASDI